MKMMMHEEIERKKKGEVNRKREFENDGVWLGRHDHNVTVRLQGDTGETIHVTYVD